MTIKDLLRRCARIITLLGNASAGLKNLIRLSHPYSHTESITSWRPSDRYHAGPHATEYMLSLIAIVVDSQQPEVQSIFCYRDIPIFNYPCFTS